MARLKSAPEFVDVLKETIVEELKKVGINADVDAESVPTTRLYRLYVLPPKFNALRHTERQDLVWRIAQRALSPEDQLRISMIVTLTPKEAEGK